MWSFVIAAMEALTSAKHGCSQAAVTQELKADPKQRTHTAPNGEAQGSVRILLLTSVLKQGFLGTEQEPCVSTRH